MTKVYNGGYIMLDLADENLYSNAKNAIGKGKPIMVFDGDDVYYADTIKLSDTDVILTKGGKTITIASDGTITSDGEIQKHLYCYYSSYFNIVNNENDEIYLVFNAYSSENLSDLITELNKDFTTSQKAYNDLRSFLDKVKQIISVSGGDYSYSGVMYNSTSSIQYSFDGNEITLTESNIASLTANIKMVQIL